MLKNFPLVALVALGLAAGVLGIIADEEFLVRQRTVYQLFYTKPNFGKIFPEWVNIGRSHNISDPSLYTKEGVADEFLQRLRHGILPRDAVFSPFYPVPLDEAKSLFKLFYYAKDFETFAKTAAWARQYVNLGQYAYALSVAVMHRSETRHIKIPPLYTARPELYFNAELFPKIIESWTQLESETEKQEIVIPLNYSEWYVGYTGNNELRLNYFTEDIILNSIYELSNLAHPFWASAKEYDFLSKNRGEMYLSSYEFLFARYYMERLSNGLGDVHPIDWYGPIPTGYYPSMNYANGLPFPQRPENSRIPAYYNVAFERLRSCKNRIFEAIDSGILVAANGSFIHLNTSNAMEYLGNIIEGNADSINPGFYGYFEGFARALLGFSPKSFDKHKFVPSALQHYATSPRDPIFWSMVKEIVGMSHELNMKQPKYTYEQLAFPGVKIESFDISKLVTYFNATDHWVDGYPKGRIAVRQYHLNNYPVKYSMNVYSDIATKATIRIFFGPKYDVYGNEIDIVESHKYFIVADDFIVHLKVGLNEIVRHSYESSLVHEYDLPSADVFYESINDAIAEGKPFEYKEQIQGYPDFYFLPKGTKNGLPLQFICFVGRVEDSEITYTSSRFLGSRGYRMKYPKFPLDRPPYSHNFTLPNLHFKDMLVFHEE